MYRIEGRIEGIADLLFNAWTPRALKSLRDKEGGGKQSAREILEEAKRKVHRNGRHLVMPRINFKKCLLTGVKLAKLKEGKSSLWPYVNATVFVENDLDLGKKEPDYIHECVGRNENTGQGIWVMRPALRAPWKANFVLVVQDPRRNPDQLETALREGGLLGGIGSYRPEFGRFLVKAWKVIGSKTKGKKASG